LISIIFFFLIRDFARNWQSIPFDKIRFSPLPIILSYLLLLATFLIFIKAWQGILSSLGDRLDFRSSFWIMGTSQMGKYMPGKIWFFLGRVYMAKQANLKGVNVALSVLVETVLTVVWGTIIVLTSLFLTEAKAPLPLWVILLVTILGIAVLHPAVLSLIVNSILTVLKKERISIPMSFRHMIVLSFYYLGLWVTQIAGFYLLMNSLYRVPLANLSTVVFVYTTSWILGFLAPFAPGGLGVREGIMSLGLSTIMPPGLAIGISFLSRVWLTLFEIIIFGVSLIIRPRKQP
jgi:hypothetical protein